MESEDKTVLLMLSPFRAHSVQERNRARTCDQEGGRAARLALRDDEAEERARAGRADGLRQVAPEARPGLRGPVPRPQPLHGELARAAPGDLGRDGGDQGVREGEVGRRLELPAAGPGDHPRDGYDPARRQSE